MLGNKDNDTNCYDGFQDLGDHENLYVAVIRHLLTNFRPLDDDSLCL